MQYYVMEGSPKGEFNASSKARNDVVEICKECNFKPFYVPTEYGVQDKIWMKWKQLLIYKNNFSSWRKKINELKQDDVIYIQYPLLNTTEGFEKILKFCEKKSIKTIAIIHDLDSLRFSIESDGKRVYDRVNFEDNTYLPLFSKVICHNDLMKNELIKKGVKKDNIIALGVFDYLSQSKTKNVTLDKNHPIVIAGNLNPIKAGYIKHLNQIDQVDFNLYGSEYKESNAKNVHYKGAFKPEELINEIEGSFGLVWDGSSTEGCSGNYGNYTRYNNPHKVSMYLAAGIPVIVWGEAAISKFVSNNKVGITIHSLNELGNKIENMSQEEYLEIKNNCDKISQLIRSGYYMKKALKLVEYK